MKLIRLAGLLFLLLFFVTLGYGQSSRTILEAGQPPLTQEMVDRLESVYGTILDIRLTAMQRVRFQKGLVLYWSTSNSAGINGSLSNLKYYGRPDELASLRSASQKVIVETLRRDIESTGDDVSRVLVEAFDSAHSDLRSVTRAKTFADLIGTWKRTDFLVAEKNSYGGQVGSSYTDTSVLEIRSDGSYKLIKVHDHYGSGCSRRDASTEQGIVGASGVNLIFQIKSGSSETVDGCLNRSSHTVAKPHTDTFPWSIRPNPDNGNVATLCINASEETAICYERQ